MLNELLQHKLTMFGRIKLLLQALSVFLMIPLLEPLVIHTLPTAGPKVLRKASVLTQATVQL
jgi:hypothetical protein